MKLGKWLWPNTAKWRFEVRHTGVNESSRWRIYECWIDWCGDSHVWSYQEPVLDVGAESLEDLKDALEKMMKCVDKAIKEEE